MRIFAHRGVSAELPENTLPAFERAVELGCEGIELDVWLSRDGIPAVIHDETVDRTTNGTGRIAEFTMHELRSLDAGGGAYVPSLGEVLAVAEGRLSVNVEIKDPHAVEAALEEVEQHPEADTFFSSENPSVLHELRRRSPWVELYPLVGSGSLGAGVQLARDIAGRGVSVAWQGLTREGVDAAHGEGLDVWVWTVNTADLVAELGKLGVDAVCTDDPLRVRG